MSGQVFRTAALRRRAAAGLPAAGLPAEELWVTPRRRFAVIWGVVLLLVLSAAGLALIRVPRHVSGLATVKMAATLTAASGTRGTAVAAGAAASGLSLVAILPPSADPVVAGSRALLTLPNRPAPVDCAVVKAAPKTAGPGSQRWEMTLTCPGDPDATGSPDGAHGLGAVGGGGAGALAGGSERAVGGGVGTLTGRVVGEVTVERGTDTAGAVLLGGGSR